MFLECFFLPCFVCYRNCLLSLSVTLCWTLIKSFTFENYQQSKTTPISHLPSSTGSLCFTWILTWVSRVCLQHTRPVSAAWCTKSFKLLTLPRRGSWGLMGLLAMAESGLSDPLQLRNRWLSESPDPWSGRTWMNYVGLSELMRKCLLWVFI